MVNQEAIRKVLMSPGEFSRLLPATQLRPYQAAAAQAIVDGIYNRTQDALMAMIFSRQSGKDETLAQLITFLLLRHSRTGGSIVLACPVKDQTFTTMSRTLERAEAHPLTSRMVTKRDNVIEIGRAKATFVSAGSSVRGLTASLALIANEAQDIDPARWDAVFDPMAASTNAPTIFSGTIWTANTLLSRQMRYAQDLEKEDRRKRVHLVPWREVAKYVPAYGDRVRARIAQLGASHPFIRTEYELIELDAGATMFTEQRLAMLQGAHPRQRAPLEGDRVVFLLDVAGADEAIADGASADPESARDSNILTIVRISHDSFDNLPRYRTLDRVVWVNTPWQTVQGAMSELITRWKPIMTVVDATGIGHGMWQNLQAANKSAKIEPFIFSSSSKSAIGWQVLGLIDSARFQEYAQDGQDDTEEHWWQLRHVISEIRSGPTRLLSYGIPASAGHDDSVLSMMLLGHLDTMDLRPRIARGS